MQAGCHLAKLFVVMQVPCRCRRPTQLLLPHLVPGHSPTLVVPGALLAANGVVPFVARSVQGCSSMHLSQNVVHFHRHDLAVPLVAMVC